MASVLPPKKSLKRKTIDSAKVKTSQMGNWWDRTYPKWRIWQLVALIGFIFLVLMWGISWLLRIGVFGDLTGQNIATTAMTMTGGLVAISYVVLKYRERISVEKAEQREDEQAADRKLSEAVTLLSDDKPIIQISGVYALAGVADEYGGSYNQRAVDILCAYIRSNKDPNYAVVESTIMGEMRKRTTDFHQNNGKLPASNTQWSDCKFDFHGAVLYEEHRFFGQLFTEAVDVSEARFMKPLLVQHCCLKGGLYAYRTNFNGSVIFSGVRYGGTNLNFSESTFKSYLSLYDLIPLNECVVFPPSFSGAAFHVSEDETTPFRQGNGKTLETQNVSITDIAPGAFLINGKKQAELEGDRAEESISIPVGAKIVWNDSNM